MTDHSKEHPWTLSTVAVALALLVLHSGHAHSAPRPWSQAPSTVLADFDRAPGHVARWSFSNGPEFSGAAGALNEVVGRSGRGAKLSYDLGCGHDRWGTSKERSCGRYVAMTMALQPPLKVSEADKPTIAFDVRNVQASVAPALRVIDRTGQTLQFRLNSRPIENMSGQDWQHVQTPIGTSTLFFGGANDGVLHPPIKELSILAGDIPLPAPLGSLEVDNLAYLNSPDSIYRLTADAALSTQHFAPTYVGRVGVALSRSTSHAALDKAVQVGLTVMRIDLHWQRVESKGKFDFSAYDSIAQELAKRNASVLWILCYGHTDHGGVVPLSDDDQAAFAEYARQSAAHFKGRNVVGYEIWNEPNWPQLWPKPDPIAYANLLSRTVKAIRSADPSATIVTGGVADTDHNYLIKMMDGNKAVGVNAIGVHPYRKTGFETFSTQTSVLKQLIQSQGLTVPIWNTESGYSSYGDIELAKYGNGHDPRARRRQGALVLRMVMTQLAMNMPLSVVYSMVDRDNDPLEREHNFGFLTSTGSDKPSILGMRTLYATQKGRVFKGFLPDVPPGLHVLRWDGRSDKVFALWNDASHGAQVRVNLPSKTSKITRWDGVSVVPNGPSPTSHLTLTEADGPVFVTLTD